MKRTLFLPLALALAACHPQGASNTASIAPSRESPSPPATAAAAAAQPNPAEVHASTSGPSPASTPKDSLSDTVITARTKAAILSDPGMTGSDVSVNTDRGVVSLTGTIKSTEQAAIASAHAQRQDGVLRIDNHLAANLQ